MRLFEYRRLVFFILLTPFQVAHASRLTIEWEKIPGAAQYEIELLQDQRVITDQKVAAQRSSLILEEPAGAYGYRLRTFDSAGHPGEWSPVLPLVLPPASPSLVSPGNGDTVDGDGALLRWSAAGDAQRYQLEVFRGSDIVYSETLRGTESRVTRLRAGRYFWRVHSITDLAHPTSDGRRALVGRPGETRSFTLREAEASQASTPAAPAGENSGHVLRVSLGLIVMPYSYSSSGDTPARTSSANALTSGVGFGAGYGISPRWSLTAGMDYVPCNIAPAAGDNIHVERLDFGLGARYGMPLGDGGDGWQMELEAGLAARKFYTILPQNSADPGTLLNQPFASGPDAVVQIEKKVTSRLDLGMRLDYFLPLSLGNGLTSSLSGASLDNFTLAFVGRYDVGAAWAIDLAVAHAWRGVRYETDGDQREVHLDTDGAELTLNLSHQFAL